MKDSQVALSVLTKDSPRSVLEVVRSSGLPHKQVIVVSNGSCDAADREIRKTLPDVTFVQLRPPRGIAYCWNLAVRLPAEAKWAVQPGWTVLSNDDVLFDKDWLPKLGAAIAKHPKALQIALAYPRHRYSCFALHRELVRRIGWFDERFTGMFYEDDDWHLRLCEYSQCAPGTRVHEAQANGVFAAIKCALHDHSRRTSRSKDRARFGFKLTLSKAPNKAFFYEKWKVVERNGWCGKGLPGRFARHLPEVEWYPRSLLERAPR